MTNKRKKKPSLTTPLKTGMQGMMGMAGVGLAGGVAQSALSGSPAAQAGVGKVTGALPMMGTLVGGKMMLDTAKVLQESTKDLEPKTKRRKMKYGF